MCYIPVCIPAQGEPGFHECVLIIARSTVPFRFHGLATIGTIFFLFNLLLFVFNVVMISLRFRLYPETFKASFLHPTESLFVPASVVSFGTILINISQYGLYETGPWLNTTVCVLFWVDVVLAFVASFGIYLLMLAVPHGIAQGRVNLL